VMQQGECAWSEGRGPMGQYKPHRQAQTRNIPSVSNHTRMPEGLYAYRTLSLCYARKLLAVLALWCVGGRDG